MSPSTCTVRFIDKEHYLRNLGSEDAVYMSKEVFDQLASGDSKEEDENIPPCACHIGRSEGVHVTNCYNSFLCLFV